MGCFPTKESTETDDELDLDSTPLLEEASRSESQREDQVLPPKQGRDQFYKSTDPRLETLLLKLEHAQSLREKVRRLKSKTELENYRLKIIGLLNAATMEMSRLTKERKHSEAERIVKEVMRLKNVLGDEFFESARINAFGREITELGSYLLTGGQYFKPVMIQEDDDSIVKLYFFVISDAETTEVLFRYYLEHASFLDEYFALGLVTAEGHTQVEIYGNSCPPYWKIRRDVINNATVRLNDLENSNEYDNFSESSLT
ncbi:hypothetical protein ACROYT_G000875 [Oculina patagonica]